MIAPALSTNLSEDSWFEGKFDDAIAQAGRARELFWYQAVLVRFSFVHFLFDMNSKACIY